MLNKQLINSSHLNCFLWFNTVLFFKSGPDPRFRLYYCYPNTVKGFMCGRSMQSHVLRDTTWSHVGKPEPWLDQSFVMTWSLWFHVAYIYLTQLLFQHKNTIHTRTSSTNFEPFLFRVNLNNGDIRLSLKYFWYSHKWANSYHARYT